MWFFKKRFGQGNNSKGGITYSDLRTNKEKWIETNRDNIYDTFLQSANPTIIPEESRNLPIKDCKVFVLEDFKAIREWWERLLPLVGIQADNVYFAKNVDEAKEVRWDNHFDLAILDHSINHSNLTGSDFLMRLMQEKYPDGTNRPVIMGNSSWFAHGSWSLGLFFNNPFMQDQLNKEISSSEKLTERIQKAMKEMNINLLID